jgi:DTW domain-containing protein YfiP
LILLDGTWKKAYKMFKLSKNLCGLPQISLPEALASAGQYHIRKVAKKNALSSLEACCYALELFEKNDKYQQLIDKFVEFNAFQLSFRPQEHQK